MPCFLATAHQSFEQIDEQLSRQPALVGNEQECAFCVDRRGGDDALALPQPADHWRIAPLGPDIAMHRIGAIAGFVPEVDFGILRLGLSCNGRKGFGLPALNGFRSTLVGALQRLLRRKVDFGEQAPTKVTPKLKLNFWSMRSRTIFAATNQNQCRSNVVAPCPGYPDTVLRSIRCRNGNERLLPQTAGFASNVSQPPPITAHPTPSNRGF